MLVASCAFKYVDGRGKFAVRNFYRWSQEFWKYSELFIYFKLYISFSANLRILPFHDLWFEICTCILVKVSLPCWPIIFNYTLLSIPKFFLCFISLSRTRRSTLRIISLVTSIAWRIHSNWKRAIFTIRDLQFSFPSFF